MRREKISLFIIFYIFAFAGKKKLEIQRRDICCGSFSLLRDEPSPQLLGNPWVVLVEQFHVNQLLNLPLSRQTVVKTF